MKIFRNFGCDLFYAKSFWYTLRIISHANIYLQASLKNILIGIMSVAVFEAERKLLHLKLFSYSISVCLFDEGLLDAN